MSFSAHITSSRAARRAGAAYLAGTLITIAGLLLCPPAEAQGYGWSGNLSMQPVQYRGPGFSENAANEDGPRQAARVRREQQMQGQRPQQIDRAQEPVAPQSPRYRSPEPNDARAGRPGRLTPEERRALRQQIDEAGRDVYRDSPRR